MKEDEFQMISPHQRCYIHANRDNLLLVCGTIASGLHG